MMFSQLKNTKLLLTVIVVLFATVPVTQAGTKTLINAWHLPSNTEPPPVTMRNPVLPDTDTEHIFIYVGAYPQQSIWSGTLYYRNQVDNDWQTTAFDFDTNLQPNEYWISDFNNAYNAGDVVEYFIKVTGDTAFATDTYVYFDAFSGYAKSADYNLAVSSPYAFTIQGQIDTPTPTAAPDTPTPTPSPQPGMMNIWHIPGNMEPPSVTMRNPLYPYSDTQFVYCYLGGYPQDTIESAILYHKHVNEIVWHGSPMVFDSYNGNNEYWIGQFNLALLYPPGYLVQYYFEAQGTGYLTTFAHEMDGNMSLTSERSEAENAPFYFLVEDVPTQTPTATETPTGAPTYTPTVTPVPTVHLMNVWHIPGNYEPPSVTMRNPVQPNEATEYVYIYVGGYPQGEIDQANLYYKSHNDMTWQVSPMTFDSNNGNNEYYLGSFPIQGQYPEGYLIQYFVEASSANYTTTYVYEIDGNMSLTDSQSVAEQHPFTFVVQEAPVDTPTATDTPTGQPTITPTATPEPTMILINAWHIPESQEPYPNTMRSPVNPDEADLQISFFVGAYPHATLQSTELNLYHPTSQMWESHTLHFSQHLANNEYWQVKVNNDFPANEPISYFFKLTGTESFYETTYLYYDLNNANAATSDMNIAVNSPFTFTIATSTPTPVPTATATPTAHLMNIWHYPSHEEPPSVTMRNPVAPNMDTNMVYIYIGGYPQGVINSASLYYKDSADLNWNATTFAFDSYNGNNEYYIASFPVKGVYGENDVVEYYIEAENPTYEITYIHEYQGNPQTTNDGAMAAMNPFSFTIPEAAYTVTMGIGWNSFTFPCTPDTSYNAQQFGESLVNAGISCSHVANWTGSGWQIYQYGLPFNNFIMEVGQGYFVRCDSGGSWSLQGTPITESQELNIGIGWNSVGLPYLGTSYTVASFADAANNAGGGITHIARWYSGGWQIHQVGLPFNVFPIETKAYFIRSQSSFTWQP